MVMMIMVMIIVDISNASFLTIDLRRPVAPFCPRQPNSALLPNSDTV